MSPGPWPVWHQAPDAASAAQALAGAVAAQLREATDRRGQALLAVSGGRSPVDFFEALHSQALPWAQVTVLLADERCVLPDAPDSNAALVRQHLLKGPAAAAHFLPFFDALPATGPEQAGLAALAEARLAKLPWPLDVLVLGMGEDGHTASLFPGAPGLEEALSGPARVAWVRPTSAPHARLTLTLPVLEQARHVHLALSGPAKRAVFERACAQPGPALPISLVLQRPGPPVEIWYAP